MQTDTVIDVDVNMDIAPQCEHSQHQINVLSHSGDAKYLISKRSHGCRPSRSFLICGPVWEDTGRRGILCYACSVEFPRDDLWKIIEVL